MDWKKAIGWLVWQAGSRLPTARARTSALGLRTRQSWYRGRIADVELYGGERVWLTHLDQNYLSFQLFWKSWRHFEPLTTALLAELLSDRQVFFDIGANIGYYALTAAALYPELDIVAFEPNPKLAAILRRNVVHNGLPIAIEQCAISDRSTTRTLFVPESDMSASLTPSFNQVVDQTLVVETRSLDDYLAGRSGPQAAGTMVLKIDTEGHEPEVLQGAEQTLAQRRPDLILEVTEDFDSDSEERLRRLGYRFYPITDSGLDEREALTVCRRGDFLFLNALVSARSSFEMAGLRRRYSERISSILAEVDLRATSLYRPED